MAKRCSKKRLLEFAQELRAAGGGNSLDALLPGEPGEQRKCLIARNLNFGCQVNTDSPRGGWYIKIPKGAEIISKLVDEMGLKPKKNTKIAAYLPDDIGQYAADFDTAGNHASMLRYPNEKYTASAWSLLKAMWEHLPEHLKENAAPCFVTKNGNLKEFSKLAPRNRRG